jgi:hypothetical protein
MGNTKACFIAFCILVGTVGQCFAVYTGNEIREECSINVHNPKSTSMDGYKGGFCNGFLWGVFQLGSDLAEPGRFCRPDDANLEQAFLVLLKYLDEHPEQTDVNAVTLAVRAFKAAWPCH